MQAQGEHVIIRKPNKKKATDAGLVLPDTMNQKLSYGRVVSVGPGVEAMGVSIVKGDIVAYHPQGVEDLSFGALADIDMVIGHATHVFCTMSTEELDERKLPIPL